MKALNFLLVAGLSPVVAWSDCHNIDLTVTTPNYSFNSNTAPSLNLHLDKSGSNGCSWFITVDNGDAPSYSTRNMDNGSYKIPMQIYSDSGHTKVLKHFPDITSSSDIITGSFGAGNQNTDVTYYPEMGAVAYDRFGTYDDKFKIRVYQGTFDGANDLQSTKDSKFTYTMAKKIDLSLVDTGAPFNINDTVQPLSFGPLSTGLQRAMDVVLKYNAGYSVKFSSANNGKLKHQTLADTVNYTMTVSGNPISLTSSNASPVVVASGSGISPALGQRFAVVATIGNVGAVGAGTYSDTITVTVTTTE